MAVNLSPVGGVAAQFFTNTGAVLTGGKIYTYLAGTTTPVATYTSSSGATAWTNPIVLNAAGRVPSGGEIWLTDGILYKFVLEDANNVLIATYDNISGISNVTLPIDATEVNTTIGYAGGVQRTQQSVNNDDVCVFDFMTPAQIAAVKANTSAGDLTSPVQNAINTGKAVYFPAGTYLFNVVINNKTVLYGDGSLVSIIKPFSYASPAMIYTYAAVVNPVFSFWNYHSEVRNLGFFGTGAGATATGIGFSFGTGSPSTYTANAEYANNVKFYGCLFSNLEKGVQFPFGNIGTEFYSCGFQRNYYGVYLINNKSGSGDLMHAGNKYFYAGEFNSNICAIYYNNTADGGGALNFTDTIIEQNYIGAYIYNDFSQVVPVSFTNVWTEANGATGSFPPVTIDAWSGSTRSTQTIPSRTFIVDGGQNNVTFYNSFFTDCYVKATKGQVTATDCRTENNTGNNGAPSNVDSIDSSIRLINPNWSSGGPARGFNITSTGFVTDVTAVISSSATASLLRWFTTTTRSSKIANYGSSLADATTFTSAESTTGSFSLTGTVVSDGAIYSTCNQFTRAAFLSTEFTKVVNTTITTSAGWYVFTVDIKVTAGAPKFYMWDQSTAQFATVITCETQNKWYSFSSVAYSPGSQTIFLDASGDNGTCTWRLSAFQIHRFDTRDEAVSFLATGAYTES